MVKRIQVVITGANGFVAKNLRKYLSENNVDLISISRSDFKEYSNCLLYTSPSPRDKRQSRMPSSA